MQIVLKQLIEQSRKTSKTTEHWNVCTIISVNLSTELILSLTTQLRPIERL